MFLGLRTVIHPAPDLAAAKAWFAGVLGVDPYFDQPFYVGFQVGGYELALDPNAAPEAGPITYWGVADTSVALERLVRAGAVAQGGVQDVGDGIRTATVDLPHGAGTLGIIENPHFRIEPVESTGPGR